MSEYKSFELRVGKTNHTVKVPADKPLLWVLREDLGMTGTKYGCGVGMCGACTIIVDGQAIRSCVTPVTAAENVQVQTIETLDDELSQALKKAWCDGNVSQCGYCQPGQIVATYGLLAIREPGAKIDLKQTLTNICRCGTYGRIHRTIEGLIADMDQVN